MKALVTGASGFVGRHLVPKLIEQGYDVTCLDKKDGESFEHWKLFKAKQFDVVWHGAANIIDIDARVKGKVECFQDLVLDYEVCEYIQSYPPTKCFVAMSSCAAQFPAEEDPYSLLKQALEKMALNLHKQGVPVSILRPFSGYSHTQAPSYPFPAILSRAKKMENPLTVWGNTETVRDWIHIDDLTDAILWAIEEGPRGVPVQIGTGVGTTFGKLAEMMADAVGYAPRVMALSDKAAGCPWRVADTSLAESHGWRAKISLAAGIERALILRSAFEREDAIQKIMAKPQ